MAKVNTAGEGSGNRQSAYIARNRAALIKSAQEVLAEVGLHATIDHLATNAAADAAPNITTSLQPKPKLRLHACPTEHACHHYACSASLHAISTKMHS